jgi:rhamnopyranosyl-N-acetylglucosaminyl-diphospho-decaprenol beta-1,3/1,4-galactofuranosyltransferase
MKIIALVVTHNRCALLQQSIAALQQQTVPIEIVVVNNGSTDQTADWLSTQAVQVVTQSNQGASGGFFTGIRTAYQQGADWIWAMDDDTIPSPMALEQLVHTAQAVAAASTTQAVGFVVSRANWTDGNPHRMNVPDFADQATQLDPMQSNTGLWQQVRAASFVSLLLSRQAVTTCGLPLREFFIWADDTEYTLRITRTGLLGIYAPNSIVLHKTITNHSANIFEATPQEATKHFYGIRNKLYCRRLWKGPFSYWRNIFKHLLILPIRILLKRRSHRWTFIMINWKATLASLFFNPTIHRVA